ncbi:UbiA family prenyltransferase [Paludisphaera rhizosphaerae]|uniref:UbiA family prenyltransferase n=1 Tax=Paludisphaera rhizosphaerae TaxID=2711216 RepID=UPI00197E25C7|nr:UbiA family prenyltransferase [Paludisphaera rhizosphaerae]
MTMLATVVERPLCVDLDGTLIASDMLWESLFDVAKKRPSDLMKLPTWFVDGRAMLKRRLADRSDVDVTLLPYRADVLEFLRRERARGRRVVLATAADERIANEIAEHLEVFDEVIASDGQRNLKGRAKREVLEARFGAGGFDYIGDSTSDCEVWSSAADALVVGGRLVRRCRGIVREPAMVFETQSRIRPLIRAMRPHQWAKNVLLFVVPLVAHAFDVATWMAAAVAFVCFSLTASSVYILNDLLDLEADRRHVRKRLRPFASGAASIPAGVAVSLASLAAAAALAATLPPAFGGLLLLYLVLTTLYSTVFKRRLMIDVVCLAGLYTLRIVAGGAAVSIVPSHWLLAFSMFFFLSLAFAKRYSELSRCRVAGRLPGRGYGLEDLDLIRSLGPTSSYVCVLVFAMYLNSPDVHSHYRRPEILWLMSPVLLYWLSRLWFLACRKQLDEDPVLFALHDRISRVCGVIMAILFAAAI